MALVVLISGSDGSYCSSGLYGSFVSRISNGIGIFLANAIMTILLYSNNSAL